MSRQCTGCQNHIFFFIWCMEQIWLQSPGAWSKLAPPGAGFGFPGAPVGSKVTHFFSGWSQLLYKQRAVAYTLALESLQVLYKHIKPLKCHQTPNICYIPHNTLKSPRSQHRHLATNKILQDDASHNKHQSYVTSLNTKYTLQAT